MDSPSQKDVTYDLRLLENSRAKWTRSSALRLVYGDIFREVYGDMAEGKTLEIGSGIGNAREFIPDLVTSDVVKTPFVDIEASAYNLPLPEDEETGWGNILAFDVLHHLCRPFDFFASAFQVLRPGGRIVLVEPAATPWGRLFYRLCHPEPIAPGRLQPPFVEEPDASGEFANMGMGVSLFVQHRSHVEAQLAGIGGKVVSLSFRDFLAYPLTGGYGSRQLMPGGVIRFFLSIERSLPRSVYRMIGLRMLIVLEKTALPADRAAS